MKQDTASKILSDITVHMKYARYLPKSTRSTNSFMTKKYSHQ